MSAFLEDVDIDTALNASRVTVEADINVPTHFFNMIGVQQLGTVVSSVAAEAIGDVEVSLVLDVSGSMGGSKMTHLKQAGEDFVDAMYANAATGSVSISVIPYTTQVSAGPDILEHFTDRDEAHANSHCLKFNDDDYRTTVLDPEAPIEQAMHFDPWTRENQGWWYNPDHSQGPVRNTVCRHQDWYDVFDILLFSENQQEIKDYINDFWASDWTSIEIGLKWGAATLDPSFRDIVEAHVEDGDVGEAFRGRPYDYNTADGLKVLVVMTDGQNTENYEMNDPYRSGESFVYQYTVPGTNKKYFSIWGGDPADPLNYVRTRTETRTDWLCSSWYYYYGWRCSNWYQETTTYEVEVRDWYLINRYNGDGVSTGWRAAAYAGNGVAERMTWDEVWQHIPVEVFTDQYLSAMSYSSTTRGEIKSARRYVNQATKDTRTLEICGAAKAQGVLIYAIGFEAPVSSETLLQNCVTTPANFFDVEGAEISQAFAAIAADVARLRLLE